MNRAVRNELWRETSLDGPAWQPALGGGTARPYGGPARPKGMGKGAPTVLKAAQGGDAGLLTQLLEAGANVHEIDTERSGAVHRAAREGHVAALRVLLRHKADVNARDRRQVSALHEASKNGHEDCVTLLLEHKADPNCKKMNSSVTNGGFTPLHFAASRGQLSCMQALVAAGGDVHGGDRAGECPLHVSVRCDSEATVVWLLERGLSPLVVSHNGRTSLHVAALHGRLSCAQALLTAAGSQRKDLVLTADCGGMLALHEAAAGGHIDMLELLLQDTEVDTCDDKGRTALLCAAEERHYEAARFLVQAGAAKQARHKQVAAALAGEAQEDEPASFLQQAIMKVSPLARNIIETRQAASEAAAELPPGCDGGGEGRETGKQRRKAKRRQRKDVAGGLVSGEWDECGEGWQHGVFLVPAAPIEQLPAVLSLMQAPYPWGELHVTSCRFIPALSHDSMLAAKAAVAALPRPRMQAARVCDKLGWRRNLVIALTSDGGAHVDADSFVRAHVAVTPAEAPGGVGGDSLTATLQYGVCEDAAGAVEEAVAEAVQREVCAIDWEFAFVSVLVLVARFLFFCVLWPCSEPPCLPFQNRHPV